MAASERARGRRREAGYVTAETAVLLPVFILLTSGMLWLITAVAAQMRCVDAAALGARAAARGDGLERASAAAAAAAPRGAEVSVTEADGMVTVQVSAPAPGPEALARRTGITVRASATAPVEYAFGTPFSVAARLPTPPEAAS
ncbi:TadE family type IV pilus minor pilin [Allostreptomyces psammosilenae]|uniref:Flp pilus assembly protein TadG n=1 Tax=Allostreptomyces psammosilenae TaxID=1892865 RepID=A0A852ZTF5_9ACTN|nr:TadE family type IV pilus minor pilin [Allostreptomyces psammosilenae]NYI05619.1 Flp pilus assembly protein TadG [Allostreptomyces psammosilenae]